MKKKNNFVNKEMYEGLIQHNLVKSKKQKYYYEYHMGECPICGRNQSYKVRIKGKKPKDTTKIYIEMSSIECYDNCI